MKPGQGADGAGSASGFSRAYRRPERRSPAFFPERPFSRREAAGNRQEGPAGNQGEGDRPRTMVFRFQRPDR